MNSKTLSSSFQFKNNFLRKSFRTNYWQIAMTVILALIVAGYSANILTGIASLSFCAVIVLGIVMKLAYDVLTADYDVSLDNHELKSIHDDLWN